MISMPSWEEMFRQRQWGQWPDAALIRFFKGQFLSQWSFGEKPAVLEIGAGAGANLWFLARDGADVAAVDVSATAIALALAKLDQEVLDWCDEGNRDERLVVCSATALRYADQSFDVVLDIECLAHLDWTSARQAVEECFRVAKPGAWLFCRMLDDTNELQGEPHGSDGLVLVNGGLLDGMPPLRLVGRDRIRELLEPWSVQSIDREFRTMGNGSRSLSEHIVVARKLS